MPISSYIEILWRRRRLLILCLSLSVIYAVLDWHWSRSYESYGTIMFQKASGGVLDRLAGGGGMASQMPMAVRAEFDRQLIFLRSRPFVRLAAQRIFEHELRQQFLMDLNDSPKKGIGALLDGFLGEDSAEGSTSDLLSRIERGISGKIVISGRQNSIIEVGVKLRNPRTVGKLAAVVQLAAIEFLTKIELQELDESRRYLHKKRQEAEASIKSIDDEFLSIDQSSEMVLTGGSGTSLGSGAIEGYQKTKVQLEENRQLIARIREQIKEKENLFFSKTVRSGGLAELRRDIDTLTTKKRALEAEGFSAGSRQVKIVDEQLKEAEERYLAIGDTAVDESMDPAFSYVNLTDKLRDLNQENVYLSAKLEALQMIFKPEAGGASPASEVRKMSYLLKRAELQYAFYSELTRRLFDVDVRRIIVQNQLTILEPPSGATTVRRPALAKNLVLAVFFACAVGVSLVFQMEQMNPLLVDGRDVEGMMVRVLGYVPDLTPRWGRRKPQNWEKTLSLNLQRPDSREGLVFKHLRTRLLQFVEQGERSVHRLVITSSSPGEGKSFVSLNIALALTKLGKRVLLVDADLRARKITRSLAPSSLQGLAGPPGRDIRKEILINCVGNLDFLPAGDLPEDPTEYVAMPEVALDLEAASQGYEFVIIDTPPSVQFPDALSLARHADAAILVGTSGETRLKNFGSVVEHFEGVGLPLWVVFNKSAGPIHKSYTAYPTMKPPSASAKVAA